MKNLYALLCIVLVVLGHPAALAESGAKLTLPGTITQLFSGSGDQEFLDPDIAFQVVARQGDARTIVMDWMVVKGYYLYKDKIAVTPGDEARVTLGAVQLPDGQEIHDEYFGDVTIIDYDFQASVPVRHVAGDARTLGLVVTYQGCAKAGLCYPPLTKTLLVDFDPAAGNRATPSGPGSSPSSTSTFQSEQDRLAALLASGKLWLTVASFFGLGILLAFSPCVFPMIPILSSIIVGQGESVSASRAFGLSLAYVLAMSVTYTAAGIVVGLSGENVQIWLQNPWVLSTFAGVLVLLSLSMFGFYELRIPHAVQSRLHAASSSQKQGSYAGAGVMGFLSALIVGPCINAPLIGALIYIANVGDAVLGGIALFALSMGMGIPLLVIGTSAGKLLPKAGSWMGAVKAVSGVLLLALAIWMLDRFVPAPIVLLLSGALLITSAVYMGALESVREGVSGWFRLWKGLGVIAMVYGTVLVIGAAAGSHSLLHPLQGITARNVVQDSSGTDTYPGHALPFQQVKGVGGLDAALRKAVEGGKPVMLDFYADWCISCKEMEAFTFSDDEVQGALQDFILLQSDVTDHDEQDRALLKHLGLFGPPAILFYDPTGDEWSNYRVVGFMHASRFASHIERFKHAGSVTFGLND
ncbi:MAG: protein-disulfide reductase DsbD [Gammaproteobacteria bacterium]|nr:protein-disulfide reductase DsbD [Gammaproteobacteria bacterium]